MTDDRHYRTLGLAPGASPAEVRRAYRAVARANHPDLHPGDKAAEARFRKASAAYEVLSESWSAEPPAAAERRGAAPGAGEDAGRELRAELRERFEDLLAELLSAPGGRKARKGRTLRLELGLSLAEMARGARRKIAVPVFQWCGACEGGGGRPGGARIACAACAGRGRRRGARGVLGACPVCLGLGDTPRDPCSACGGAGWREGSRELELDVPPGVLPGVRLRVRGAGLPGSGGAEAGDLVFDLRALPDPRFALDPASGGLYGVLALDYASLLEGRTVAVETPAGPVSVAVPARQRPGAWLRLAGKGMPGHEGAGDLHLRIDLLYPAGPASAAPARRAAGPAAFELRAAEDRPPFEERRRG